MLDAGQRPQAALGDCFSVILAQPKGLGLWLIQAGVRALESA